LNIFYLGTALSLTFIVSMLKLSVMHGWRPYWM